MGSRTKGGGVEEGRHAQRPLDDSQVPAPLPPRQPLRRQVIDVQGHLMPEIMAHGTTLDMADQRLSADGSYKCMSLEAIDATAGEPRAWPKHKLPSDQRAVVVFSTDLALSEDLGGGGLISVLRPAQKDDPHTGHIRARRLPPGSFEIISGRDVDLDERPYPRLSAYDMAFEAATQRLLERARAARAALKG
jgi:hypothetical protein